MARLSSANAPDTTAIDLTRMLARLQQNLLTPDADTEYRLRSSLERRKVGINIEYAQSLLVRLEQDAQNIKVQARKLDVQTELVRKREVIGRLNERLEELNELGDYESREDESSEGEDLLGEDTPSEATDSHTPARDAPDDALFLQDQEEEQEQESTPPLQTREPPPPPTVETEPEPTSTTRTGPEPPSLLRARHKAERTELLSSATTTGSSTSTATTEALLTHNRLTQESLTSSLLTMASALKASSQAFASSLEEEKSVLDRTTEGLDKNELGLEAASRRMGYLRSMTEGRGWWGRMLMYAWIGGLWVTALVVVFVLPKLRF